MNGVSKASRVVVAIAVAAVFGMLAWADANGFGGAMPAWWLLPIVVVLAVGGLAPTLWGWRRIPVRRWLVLGAGVGVAIGWIALLALTLR